MLHDKNSQYVQGTIDRLMNGWYLFLNELFGVVGTGLGLDTLGTKSPPFYASLVLALLFILYIPQAKKMYDLIKLLREENHPAVNGLSIAFKGAAFVFGLTFLVLIIAGVLTQDTTFTSIMENR